MVFQLIPGHSFFPLCSKQGPNPSLALSPLLSVLLDKFLLSGKPFRFISHSSHAEIRAKSQAPSLNMCDSDGGGAQQGSLPMCRLTRPEVLCCIPACHTPQPGPDMSLSDSTRPPFVLIKLCHCNSCTARRAGGGLSGEAHKIPPTSAPSRFSLPAQQTWQKHFDLCSNGL